MNYPHPHCTTSVFLFLFYCFRRSASCYLKFAESFHIEDMENKTYPNSEDGDKVSSRKSRDRKKNKIKYQTEIGVIRKRIYQYYEEMKESPTISTLVDILEEDGYTYDREYLKELINKMGFRYMRCESPSRRHILQEKNDLACKRLYYLRPLKEYRAEGRNVYFMHETFMESRDVAKKRDRCLKVDLPTSISKKERLVIVHFGGPNGLINGTFTTTKAESETGDHFSEINQAKFEKWVTENLKDMLQPNSVIAISSAPHCSIQKDKQPDCYTNKKSDMEGWLRRHNVAFEEHMLNVFLYDLIKKARIKPVYVFDEIFKSLGHSVLRVPPRHPELNALEFVWADIQKSIAENHFDAPVDEKRKLWQKLYSEYSPEEWEEKVDQVKKIEAGYYDYIMKEDDINDDIIERYNKDPNSDSETCESGNEESDSMSE